MSRTNFPNGALILVCDGAKALLFENIGDELYPSLKAIDVHNEPHPPTRELGEDRPTRVYDSMDGSRSGTEQTDFHDLAEQGFIEATARALDAQVQKRKARHVTLIAPPRALGILRRAIGAPTRAVVAAELGKDLVKLPVAQIEDHLTSLGRSG